MHHLATLLATFAADGSRLPTVDPSSALQVILRIVFGVAGAVALLVITIGGLRYTVSRGDPNTVKNAKETIIYALVGLVIAISGYGIVTFVFSHL